MTHYFYNKKDIYLVDKKIYETPEQFRKKNDCDELYFAKETGTFFMDKDLDKKYLKEYERGIYFVSPFDLKITLFCKLLCKDKKTYLSQLKNLKETYFEKCKVAAF